MTQKLVANEKEVKIRELSKQSFYENVLIILQIKLRQKGGGGQCPPPDYATVEYAMFMPSICNLAA